MPNATCPKYQKQLSTCQVAHVQCQKKHVNCHTYQTMSLCHTPCHTPCHTQCHTISHHIITCHTMSHTMSYHVTQCHTVSHHVTHHVSHHVTPRHTTSHHTPYRSYLHMISLYSLPQLILRLHNLQFVYRPYSVDTFNKSEYIFELLFSYKYIFVRFF